MRLARLGIRKLFAMKALFEMLVAYCAFMNLCGWLELTAEGNMLLVRAAELPTTKGDWLARPLTPDLASCPVVYLSTLVKLRVGTVGTLGLLELLLRFEEGTWSSLASRYGLLPELVSTPVVIPPLLALLLVLSDVRAA